MRSMFSVEGSDATAKLFEPNIVVKGGVCVVLSDCASTGLPEITAKFDTDLRKTLHGVKL